MKTRNKHLAAKNKNKKTAKAGDPEQDSTALNKSGAEISNPAARNRPPRKNT